MFLWVEGTRIYCGTQRQEIVKGGGDPRTRQPFAGSPPLAA